MAFLSIPQEFSSKSTSEIVASAGSGSLPLIPEGKYQGVILKSEMKDTQTGGQMLVLSCVVTKGDHADTEFTERLNLINSNPTAVKIAYETLAKIAFAAGFEKIPDDSNKLHNKPMIFVIKTEKGTTFKDKMTGEQREGKDKSVIRSFEPLPKTGTAQPTEGTAKKALPWG